jgi:hypothetical protein
MVAGVASDRLGGDAGAGVVDHREPTCRAPAEARQLDDALEGGAQEFDTDGHALSARCADLDASAAAD